TEFLRCVNMLVILPSHPTTRARTRTNTTHQEHRFPAGEAVITAPRVRQARRAWSTGSTPGVGTGAAPYPAAILPRMRRIRAAPHDRRYRAAPDITRCVFPAA